MTVISHTQATSLRKTKTPWGRQFSAGLLLGLMGTACTKTGETDSSQPPVGSASAKPLLNLKSEPQTEPALELKNKAAAENQQKNQLKTPAAESAAPPAGATAPAPPASPAATSKTYRVAVLGDSITDARVGGGGFLKALRTACPQSQFDNFGKGGDMVNQMLRRLRRDVLSTMPAAGYTTLLVYGGVNDLYSNLSAGRVNKKIEADYQSIYAEAQAAGLEVMQMTVSPWGGFRRYFNAERSRNTRLLNAFILGQVGKKQLTRVADTYSLLSCGNPEVLCSKYETRFHDGLHPGPKGHNLLGELVQKELFFDCD